MPGIAQKISNISGDNNRAHSINQNPLVGNGKMPLHNFNGSSVSSSGSWSKHRDDVSYIQLQKYWCELTPQARQKLMRIHKQTLFEHARKNMYCSRCNGLLLEGFSQIVSYGKSLQQDIAGCRYNLRNANTLSDDNLCLENGCQYDVQDPSVHPWGGLTTARDGTLTLLDGYLCSKSLKGLQNVFDSACARERERELLYPDACGGGNRGWISQGGPGYGRGHGNRETCALHTARLSVETLVDFWSALGEETRQSLLRMKEEDFIERLMYRFDSKRFCRDCRKNVTREFKELKELKRLRRDPRCTSWFCVADTTFQYEVSHDSVKADWHQTFLDASGTYHHFEWAIGTGEGKSDILEFENVGLRVQVQVNGLDLSGLNTCYVTLRAWKKDGHCNEMCVKAQALQGQRCVHCRLVVGDGFVSITRGESIRRFFEHAEEAEEEEDDDSMDKEGNELDGECIRPQKHAKSPELAREFLLDAATVIFKEQVEKAFREGTARQNAHSIFVCLALKLLEERVHVACKEIITLEKQNQLLEDEENEKREEEERKERRRTKEKEKKLRKKERLREKGNRGKKCDESNVVLDTSVEDSIPCDNEAVNVVSSVDSISETGEATPTSPVSSDVQDDHLLTEYIYSNVQNAPEDGHNLRDWDTSLPYDHYKHSRRKLKFNKDPQHDSNLKWSDRRKGATMSEDGVKYESRYHTDGSINGLSKQSRSNPANSNIRNGNPRFGENFQCPKNRTSHRYDSHSCSCNHHDYRPRPDPRNTRLVREPKSEVSKPYYHGNKYTYVENPRRTKNKIIGGTKKVWEPLDSHKKYVRCNSDSDVTLRSSCTPQVEADESVQITKFSGDVVCNEVKEISTTYSPTTCEDNYSETYQKEAVEVTPESSTSNSDNCSSCLSETSAQNLESTSSEESSQNSETSICIENECERAVEDTTRVHEDVKVENGGKEADSHIQPLSVPPEMHNHYPPVIPMGYYHHSPISWAPTRLTPFPPFLFPNPYGYGFNGNAHFLQYGPALPPPLLNHPPRIPAFQPLPQIITKKVQDSPQVVVNEKADKMDTEEDTGFSLFHFGGPVALSTGFKADPVPMTEGITTNFLDNCHDGKKDSIEYNLFAASNSMQFSFL